MRKLTYITAPYHHENKEIVKARVELFNKITSSFISDGFFVTSLFSLEEQVMRSPSMSDYVEVAVAACDEVVVVLMEGWFTSKRVQTELEYAYTNNIPIRFIDPILHQLEG